MIMLTICFATSLLWVVLRTDLTHWGPSTPPSHLWVAPEPPSSREVVSRKRGVHQGNILDLDTKINKEICCLRFILNSRNDIGAHQKPQRPWEVGEGSNEEVERGMVGAGHASLTCPFHEPFMLKTMPARFSAFGFGVTLMFCGWVRISCPHPKMSSCWMVLCLLLSHFTGFRWA